MSKVLRGGIVGRGNRLALGEAEGEAEGEAHKQGGTAIGHANCTPSLWRCCVFFPSVVAGRGARARRSVVPRQVLWQNQTYSLQKQARIATKGAKASVWVKSREEHRGTAVQPGDEENQRKQKVLVDVVH